MVPMLLTKSMQTKDLILGFSASVKLGERLLNEYAIRYAKVVKNKTVKIDLLTN